MVRAWDEEGVAHRPYCALIDADRTDPLSNHYFRYLHDHGLADAYDHGRLPPDHPGSHTHRFVSDRPHEHSLEVPTGDETLAFLRGRDLRRPFFAQMRLQRPHEPLSPSPERAGMYPAGDIDLPDNVSDLFERGFAGKPAFQREQVTRQRPIAAHGSYPYVATDADDLRRQLTHYYALITIIDVQIGRVVDYLREAGELDNTVIAYVADHGDFAREHGLTQKNLGIYSVRTASAFRWKMPLAAMLRTAQRWDFLSRMRAVRWSVRRDW